MDEEDMRRAMRLLVGQFATPSWLREDARRLEAEGLMKFHEWPSGHWAVTERGRNFLADSTEDRSDG